MSTSIYETGNIIASGSLRFQHSSIKAILYTVIAIK